MPLSQMIFRYLTFRLWFSFSACISVALALFLTCPQATLDKFDQSISGKSIKFRDRTQTHIWEAPPIAAMQKYSVELPEFESAGAAMEPDAFFDAIVTAPLPVGTAATMKAHGPAAVVPKSEVPLNERGLLIAELFAAEMTFFTTVRQHVELWLKPLRESRLVSEAEVFSIFSVAEDLKEFHLQALKELKRHSRDAKPRPTDGGSLGSFFHLLTDKMSLQEKYFSSVLSTMVSLATQLQKQPVFDWFHRQQKAVGQQVGKFYTAPFERLQQYRTFLEDLLRLVDHGMGTPEDDPTALSQLHSDLRRLEDKHSLTRNEVTRLAPLLGLDLRVKTKLPTQAWTVLSRCHSRQIDAFVIHEKAKEAPCVLHLLSDGLLFLKPSGDGLDEVLYWLPYTAITSSSVALEVNANVSLVRFKYRLSQPIPVDVLTRGTSEDATNSMLHL